MEAETFSAIDKGSYPKSSFGSLFSTTGRYGRKKFWTVYLSVTVLSLVSIFLGYLAIPYLLILSWVSFAAIAKRFHDRGKSAWWSLIGFVPFIGALWVFVDCGILKGDPQENRFGPSPN